MWISLGCEASGWLGTHGEIAVGPCAAGTTNDYGAVVVVVWGTVVVVVGA